MREPLFNHVGRYFFGGLLLISAVAKLFDPNGFSKNQSLSGPTHSADRSVDAGRKWSACATALSNRAHERGDCCKWISVCRQSTVFVELPVVAHGQRSRPFAL